MTTRRTVIEGFHTTNPELVSVDFTEGICDPEALDTYLRTEQRVFGPSEADMVMILLDPKGPRAGEHRGTVAVMGDDEHRVQTLTDAIAALEDCRTTLLEIGHHDWEPRA